MIDGKTIKQRKLLVLAIIFVVLIVDQAVKFWVKTNMSIGESFGIFGAEWAKIYFIENPGMAFGMEFGGRSGKLFLSLFRIFAVSFLGYYIYKLIDAPVKRGLLVCFALILAGALGNIIDSAFYGKLFSESNHVLTATFLPEGGGYDTWLHGKVVDMLYFPMLRGSYPEWFPLCGGQSFLFFKPVFNIADSAISIGVFSIVLFYRQFFIQADNDKKTENESQDEEE